MVQTINDKDCRSITGLGDSESEDDNNVIGLVDMMKTFDKAKLTRTVHNQISHCFENLAEAHAMMKEGRGVPLIYSLKNRKVTCYPAGDTAYFIIVLNM